MTKKDYELIASAIAESICDMQDHPARIAGAHQVARNLARILKGNNPRFDRKRFMAACGLEEAK
jgi:hypothetical protein